MATDTALQRAKKKIIGLEATISDYKREVSHLRFDVNRFTCAAGMRSIGDRPADAKTPEKEVDVAIHRITRREIMSDRFLNIKSISGLSLDGKVEISITLPAPEGHEVAVLKWALGTFL